MKNLKQFVEDFYNGMVGATRDNGEQFIKLADDLENREVYQGIIYEVHEGALPCDVIYSTVDSVLAVICYELENADPSDKLSDLEINLDDVTLEHCLTTHRNFEYYCDQALSEFGNEVSSFSALRGNAEYIFIRDIKDLLVNAIDELEYSEWDNDEIEEY